VRLIHTVKGAGYILEERDEKASQADQAGESIVA
jgi:hypothetical protein